MFSRVWFSILFFLIYVGGLLVLFFYTLSLNSNPFVLSPPLSSSSFLILILSFFFSILILSYYGFIDFFLFSYVFDNSFILFSASNFSFMVFIGCFLIFVLLMVRVFSCILKGAFRPICI